MVKLSLLTLLLSLRLQGAVASAPKSTLLLDTMTSMGHYAASLKSDDEPARWHSVTIGANLGYAGGPAATKAAIHRAATEGVITQLRAFEPWPAGSIDPGRWTPARAPEVAAGFIADILSAHPQVDLLVSLSNYPYATPADLGTDPGKHLLRAIHMSSNFATYP